MSRAEQAAIGARERARDLARLLPTLTPDQAVTFTRDLAETLALIAESTATTHRLLSALEDATEAAHRT